MGPKRLATTGCFRRGLAGGTIRRKLAELASLFDHLLENNAVASSNPVHGVKPPLEASKHHQLDSNAPLFLPLRGRSTGTGISAGGIYALVGKYAKAAGIEVAGLCVHGLRATGATNALEHEADIAKVQMWLGHANISTTRIYNRRQRRPEDSPTFRVKY